jgi:hypothetical protein
MAVRVWGVSAAKRFKFQTLSEKHLAGVFSAYSNSFFVNENIHKVTGIAKSEKATRQMENLLEVVAQNGVSIVAVEQDTDKVVGAALNRIQVMNPNPSDSNLCYQFFGLGSKPFRSGP